MSNITALVQISLGVRKNITIEKGKYVILDHDHVKFCFSEDYNFAFDKRSGTFARWGKTLEEDPQFSPIGPEIADIEITTICHGIPDTNGKKTVCKHCYKSNTPCGENMSLETFKSVLDAFPKVLTQVAFGADSEATSNPDLWDMMRYCRSKGVVPNITVANITDETADNLASLCGAVAVSRYPNKEICYNSIEKLTDAVLRRKIIVRKKKDKKE